MSTLVLFVLLGCVGNGNIADGEPTATTDSDLPVEPPPETTVDCPLVRDAALDLAAADQVTGEGDSDQLGSGVAAVGDGRWLLGALGADAYAGAVVVYGGSDSATLKGDTTSSAGSAVAAGDLDGDGLPEVVVGGRSASAGVGQPGSVWIVDGATNLSGNAQLSAIGVRLDGTVHGGWAGHSLATPGDVDGDGLGDIIVGSPYFGTEYVPEQGGVWLVSGLKADGPLDEAGAFIPGAVETDTGWTLAGVGDSDGDGLADYLVGAPFADPARVFLLSSSVAATVEDSAIVTFKASTDVSTLGGGLDGPGDFDGDGLNDLLLGDANKDRVFLMPGGLAGEVGVDQALAGLASGEVGSQFGDSVAGGDFDCDGILDVAVGAPNPGGEGSAVVLMYGPFSGEVDASTGISADGGSDLLGYAMAAGDSNGDGLWKLAVAAPLADAGGTDLGIVYLF